MRVIGVLEKGSSIRTYNGKEYNAWHTILLMTDETKRQYTIVRSGVTLVQRDDGSVKSHSYKYTVGSMLHAAWKTRLRGRVGLWVQEDKTPKQKFRGLVILANKTLFRRKGWSEDNVFYN